MDRAQYRLELVSARERRALALGALAAIVLAASAAAVLHPALLAGQRAQPATAPPPVQVLAYQFSSDLDGWLVLRAGIGPQAPAGIYRTTDAGRTWQPLPVPVAAPSAAWLHFFDAGRGFLLLVRDESAGRASLYATADGGGSWELRTLPAAQRGEESLSFADPEDGFEVFRPAGAARSVVFRTADGGRTWSQPAMAGLGSGSTVVGPTFVDATRGFALVGSRQETRLFRTGDGGEQWEPAVTLSGFGAPSAAPTVFAFDSTVLVPLGGTLAVSHDGGESFGQFRPMPAGAGTEGSLSCTDSLHCRVAFDLTYAATDDGGTTWRTTLPRLAAHQLIAEVQAVDPRTSWAVTVGGDGQAMVVTTDGGVSWRAVPLPRP